jgi:hypothetical protein
MSSRDTSISTFPTGRSSELKYCRRVSVRGDEIIPHHMPEIATVVEDDAQYKNKNNNRAVP